MTPRTPAQAPLVHPQQQRVLIGFLRRLRARSLADAESVIWRHMNSVMTSGGTIRPAAVPPLGGDVTGAIGANTAIKIQGIPVSSDDPTTNQVLKFNGTQWAPATDAGLVNPMTTTEDLIKGGASGTPVRLAVGTTGYVLKVVAGAVAWAAEIVSALASSVVTETSFGQSSAVGVATTAARGDHTHGTPTNPVPAHEAASDPHPGYTTTAELAAALADYILETLIDAKGDLIAGTAADTAARLGVGADGQILYADSAETTGLRWGDPPTGGTSHWEVILLDGEPVTLDGGWVYVEIVD